MIAPRTREPPRIAAIDLGTNSVRLIIAEVEGPGSYRIIDEERENTRLGAGLREHGELREQPVARTLQALRNMKAIADGFDPVRLRAIATSAVREATNGAKVLERIKDEIGLEVETVSADEEGVLALASASRNFELERRSYVVVDIGGGSVELVFAAGSVVHEIHSLPLGAVRMYEQFCKSDPLKLKHQKKLRKAIDRVMDQALGQAPFSTELMVGSGGTFTALAHMAQYDREGRVDNVHGFMMSHIEVDRLLQKLYTTPLDERKKFPGLNPARADITVAGAAVIQRLLNRLGIRSVLVNDRGIRDGLLIAMMEELQAEQRQSVLEPTDRMEWVRRFARKCHSNERHVEQVARLSVRIFDCLSESYDLDPSGREILLAAALLHDVGNLISHSRHHKHAYHLIVHSGLTSFTAHELELIANVARYHRKAFPKKSHENFQRLNPSSQRSVRQLSAILRVTAGLDRTQTQVVEAVDCAIENGSVRFKLTAERDPRVEVWDASRRSGLFQAVFDTAVEFEWNGKPVGEGQ